MARGTRRYAATLLVCLAGFSGLIGETPRAWGQIGDSVAGVGPINRSMGGAAVAAPIDSAGALLWNPASITGLQKSEMEFGAEMMMLNTQIASIVHAGALGSMGPPSTMWGNTGASNGVFPLPAFGFVSKSADNTWAWGIGLFEIAGFGVNYPASRTNPVLMPQPPSGMGVGNLYSQYQLMQITPTIAVQLTDTLSLGIAADIDLSFLAVDPGFMANPTTLSTPYGKMSNYPSTAHMRSRWGGGFNVGLYYKPGDWAFGASIKSPQWFDSFSWDYVSANGRPGSTRFTMDFPMVASVGTSYSGIDRLLVALDLRFMDYRNTEGFSSTGFTSAGALKGFGWQNLFALALGTQYQLSDELSVRAGYSFSMNPIGPAMTFFNIPAPTIMHSLSIGGSYNIAQNVKLSIAYVHYFSNVNSGPMYMPGGGPISGTKVRDTTEADSVLGGITVSF